ncbi:MAG TPA: tetratricopeptide repeat protein [Alphaproteobacteria bacterium]|nr:tetratricopeptide repeat protein [Alphaproteobacteria bacterium]
MSARDFLVFRRGALAALVAAALLGGCATAGQAPVETGAASPEGLMRMGDKARDRGELTLAASIYRRAHDADPQRAKPLVSLGQVLIEMQRIDQASEAFSAALVIEPANYDALRGLGNARLMAHQPEEAIPPLKQALAISSNDFRTLNALGVAYDMTGDRGSAHQYYRTGLKLAPDNTSLRSNYALSQALAGDTEGALETMAPLAGAPVTTEQQRQTMALIYGLAGNDEEAERLARMDLHDTAVQANMERIAELRADAVSTAETPKPGSGEAKTMTAVLREPLSESSQPKAEPVALHSGPKPRPATVPTPAASSASAEPIASTRAPTWAPPTPLEQQAAATSVSTEPIAPKPTPATTLPAQQQTASAATPASIEAKPATAEAEAAEAVIKPSGDVWLVQLASYLAPELAEKGWRELSATAPELFADRKPMVEQGRLADETVVWRLRMGPYTAYSDAVGMCEQLKSRGLDCFVAQSGS